MDPFSVWAVFLVATSVHIVANYQAVTSVIMETFNNQRLRILTAHYLKNGRALTPLEVSQRESLFDFGATPKLGVSLSHLVGSLFEWNSLAKIYSAERFVLRFPARQAVQVVLRDGVTTRDLVKSCFVAHVQMQFGGDSQAQLILDGAFKGLPKDLSARAAKVYQIIQERQVFEDFEAKCLQCGWNLEHVYFLVGEWRVSNRDQ